MQSDLDVLLLLESQYKCTQLLLNLQRTNRTNNINLENIDNVEENTDELADEEDKVVLDADE